MAASALFLDPYILLRTPIPSDIPIHEGTYAPGLSLSFPPGLQTFGLLTQDVALSASAVLPKNA